MSSEASDPAPASEAAAAAEGVMLRAQLDLTTKWRFWGVLQHRDGRVFAGRIGDLRIFGTVMVRIDVPVAGATTIYGLHPDMISDWTICSEEQALTAAAIIGVPHRSIDGTDGWPESGTAMEGDDEPF